MRIGIMADSHDHVPRIREAVGVFAREGVDLVLHAGDFIAPFVIPEIARVGVPVVGVFGNNDGDCPLLLSRSREQGNVEIRGYFAELEYGGRRIALLHGHDRERLAECMESGHYDVVVHGHTHQYGIGSAGKTLSVNPGELCGYLTGNPTVAIYETGSGTARIVPL
ncbi:MAG: metallophosphoesterase [Methanolinea sp.]|nr:metallophosphoesterase [Methanolinea sp.]